MSQDFIIFSESSFTYHENSISLFFLINPKNEFVRANETNTESSDYDGIDFLSNGFKIREGDTSGVYTQTNRDNTHIYMAFAEQPGTTPFDTFPNAR